MRKLTHEEVENNIYKFGYKLLDNYRNNRTKVKIECPEGHIFNMTYANFSQGQRCPYCYGNVNKNKEEIKNTLEDHGFELLSDKYVNSKTKLKVQCKLGHITWKRYDQIVRGQRCPHCEGGIKYDFEKIKKDVEESGNYFLLSTEYVNSKTKLKLQCIKGHIFRKTYSDFWIMIECPYCRDWNSSLSERELQSHVKSFVSNVICNDKTQIYKPETKRYLELDIWVPKFNKAIEFNGKHWHSFENAKLNDKIKADTCKEKGIDLKIVHEEDWVKDKDKVLSEVEEFLCA